MENSSLMKLSCQQFRLSLQKLNNGAVMRYNFSRPISVRVHASNGVSCPGRWSASRVRQGNMTLLILLDLSVAFDIIDHQLLVSCLRLVGIGDISLPKILLSSGAVLKGSSIEWLLLYHMGFDLWGSLKFCLVTSPFKHIMTVPSFIFIFHQIREQW